MTSMLPFGTNGRLAGRLQQRCIAPLAVDYIPAIGQFLSWGTRYSWWRPCLLACIRRKCYWILPCDLGVLVDKVVSSSCSETCYSTWSSVTGTMAGGEEGGERSLQETPTWAVAAVCAVFVIISVLIEHAIHSLGKVRENFTLCSIDPSRL